MDILGATYVLTHRDYDEKLRKMNGTGKKKVRSKTLRKKKARK